MLKRQLSRIVFSLEYSFLKYLNLLAVCLASINSQSTLRSIHTETDLTVVLNLYRKFLYKVR